MKGQVIQKFLPPTTLALLNNKVDKVSGKQLSTEDFTTAEKNKLENLSDIKFYSTDPASTGSGKMWIGVI